MIGRWSTRWRVFTLLSLNMTLKSKPLVQIALYRMFETYPNHRLFNLFGERIFFKSVFQESAEWSRYVAMVLQWQVIFFFFKLIMAMQFFLTALYIDSSSKMKQISQAGHAMSKAIEMNRAPVEFAKLQVGYSNNKTHPDRYIIALWT